MNSRLSHWFPPDPTRWVSSYQTDMLLQDFRLFVVPSRRAGRVYQLSGKGITAGQIDQALTLGDHSWRLEGFLTAVATTLLTHHQVWLEVSFPEENQDRPPFSVVQVYGVRRTDRGKLVQEWPSIERLPDRVQWNEARGPETELDEERMIHITLPQAYPSHLLVEVVRDLAETSWGSEPSWSRNRSHSQHSDAPLYDADEAYRTEKLRIAQAALPIGWIGREIQLGFSRPISEYYYLLRELLFLHFRSSMRGRAEEALRQVLTLASERCGFKVSVTTSGVYTPDEVEALTDRFEAGEIPFSTVSDIRFKIGNDATSEQRCVV